MMLSTIGATKPNDAVDNRGDEAEDVVDCGHRAHLTPEVAHMSYLHRVDALKDRVDGVCGVVDSVVDERGEGDQTEVAYPVAPRLHPSEQHLHLRGVSKEEACNSR